VLSSLTCLGALDEDAGQVLAVIDEQNDPEERYYRGYRQTQAIH
jgi:hypothetical protein